jgi:hypothetical protein
VRRGADETEYEALAALVSAVQARGAGTLLFALDQGGADLAAAFLVWDAERLYFLVSARAHTPIANKAYALLFYEAICEAKRRGLAFDADDGLAVPHRASALLRWGLPISMNMEILRETLLFRGLRGAQRALAPGAVGRTGGRLRLSRARSERLCEEGADGVPDPGIA